jgi:hypothetical protein
MPRRGNLGTERDTEVSGMQRWAAAGAAAALGFAADTLVSGASAAAASPAPAITVSPSHGLRAGQSVTIVGKWFPKPGSGTNVTWFVTQCTTAVHGHLRTSTDTPHCELTTAKAVHMGKNGTFTARYRVETGIIGDGYCGTAGHLICVLGVGTVNGPGAVANITFRNPPPYPGAAPSTPTT